jgi:hypothetical protein
MARSSLYNYIYLYKMSSCWLTSNNNPILYMSPLAQVGINTISPQYPLDVSGSANISGCMQVGALSNLGSCSISGGILMNDIATAKWQMNTVGYKLNFNNDTGVSNAFISKMCLTNAGQLGVGTQTPAENLHIIGNTKISGNLISEGGHFVSTSPVVLDSGTGQFFFRKVVGSNSASWLECMDLNDSNLSVYGSATIFGSATINGSIINTGFTTVSNLATSANTLSLSTSNTAYLTASSLASLSNSVVSLSSTLATTSTTAANANSCAISASNRAFSLCKLSKSVDTNSVINTTVNWTNAYNAGNQYFLVLEANQTISSQAATAIKKTRFGISASNSTIQSISSPDVFGSSAAITSLGLSVTASTTTSCTITSTNTLAVSGLMYHNLTIETVSFPMTTIGNVWLS